MAKTGYKIVVYLDDNPLSPTYMQTYEERVLDETSCPISEDDLVLISNECEVSISGYTGYRLEIYYNRTTGEYVENRVLDSECEASSTEEQWVNSGSPYCETTEKGINTGYMLQLQVQMNPNLANYGETRTQRYKSPECGGNNCAIWEDIQKQCHIEVINCVATFDGTADISQIDNNPLSETYNQTRTINRQDSDCENCTQTTFSWLEVGTMCGDDELLCSNGIQQVSTNSYTVTQKYKTVGNKTIPMDEYQVVLHIEDDEDCGYIKPQYKMEIAPGQYLCDFETYTKYEMLIRMVSYDAGVTWSVWYDPQTGEPYTERGEVIAYDSYDCGKPMYRWVPNGEFMCEDNGDDGKFVYWDEESVMTKSYPCNESSVLTNAEYQAMTTISSGATSPDGYKSTYQVGDCVSELADGALKYFNSRLWLGNYTEKLGYESLCGYDQKTLEIPSRVNDMSHRTFGYTSWDGSRQCWNMNCGADSLYVMVMHPTTPPLLEHDDDLPQNFVLAPDDATAVEKANAYNGAAIFVPNESYDLYCTADVWLRHANSQKARILPMNNDSESHKAIIHYESDFTSWRYYIPDGESANTLGVEEKIYGRGIITAITITNKVTDIADNTFYRYNDYDGMYNLKEINLGDTVEHIGSYAFKAGSSSVQKGDVTSLLIPGSVRSIGSSAFEDYPLSSLTIHNGVETIGSYAFANHKLSGTIEIPDSVESIGKSAFRGRDNYSNIKHITIGSGCTDIDDYAFYQYKSYNKCPLETVTVKALTPPKLAGEGTHYGINIFGGAKYASGSYTPIGNYTIYVPCESYEDYINSDWSYFTGGNCSVEPYGCSGVKSTIAVLHQTDGTDIEITKPIEYRRKILSPSDINAYSSTTSAITVTDECTEFAIRSIYNYSSVDHITFEGVIPPEFTSLSENTRFVDDNQLIYVSCEGYDIYRFIFNKNLTNWGDVDKLLRISDGCIDDLQYEWIFVSSRCNAENGKIIETQKKYLVLSGVSYQTVETRDIETTDCIDMTNNGFTLGTDNTWYGHRSSTMNFKYLVNGGFTVTLYQDYSTSYGICGYVDLYDENDTKIATSYRNNGAAVGLESNKTYTVRHVEVLAGGSAQIKFNF